jgi:hypothetical protein
VPNIGRLLTRDLNVDLFEPPQRERFRDEVMRLTAQGLEQREIALRLPKKATQAAVSKANLLARMMEERGLQTPFEIVMEPPLDYLKLWRHMNAKYSFQMEEGYQRPTI